MVEKVGNARREAKSVSPLISDENNFVDFKISSWMEEVFQEVKTQKLMKITWIFKNVH